MILPGPYRARQQEIQNSPRKHDTGDSEGLDKETYFNLNYYPVKKLPAQYCFNLNKCCRYKDHLNVEHRVFYYLSWIIDKTVEENCKVCTYNHY